MASKQVSAGIALAPEPSDLKIFDKQNFGRWPIQPETMKKEGTKAPSFFMAQPALEIVNSITPVFNKFNYLSPG
jgi:hypothetical protein